MRRRTAMSIGIYPGSFDPITNGHVSIIKGALVVVDKLIVAVLSNPKKQSLFTVQERIDMIRETVGKDEPRIEVDSFDGLLVDYCRRKNVKVVVRGLRAVADFEYELQMANMNRHLYEDMETVFLMANDAYFYVSSNIVKEAASLGGDVSKLVPGNVSAQLKRKLHKP
jgi:pantetheine-phosphate adenylyltransferase